MKDVHHEPMQHTLNGVFLLWLFVLFVMKSKQTFYTCSILYTSM